MMPQTIAIVGHSESTRLDAPYGRADTEIWSMNDCHEWIPREDRHFEIHSPESYGSSGRRSRGYLEYLIQFPGPVMMQFQDDRIPGCQVLPMRAMETRYGSVFTSSISWMMAVALELDPRPNRIEIWGCDLLYAEDDYTDQRESTGYWIGYARGLGVDVVLPLGCPILTSPSYAVVERQGPVTNEFIHNRMAKLQAERRQLEAQQHVAAGRLQELAFWQSVMSGELEAPGVNTGPPKRQHIPPRGGLSTLRANQ